jgi:hypothetical protein
MAAKLWKAATVNAFSTTLNGSITGSDGTITLTTVTGLQFPGVLVIDRTDGNGNNTPTVREYISYTGISGSQLTGCSRGLAGSTNQAHNSGAIIEEAMSITHWGDLLDWLSVSHDVNGNVVISSTATMSVARVYTHINASGASITGNFPINPGWSVGGLVSLATTAVGKPLPIPQAGLLQFFCAVTRTPVSGGSLLLDINKNGVSIFTDQNTRLVFPAGGTFVSTASIGLRTLNPGDILTFDIDNGGGTASDLTVLGRAL